MKITIVGYKKEERLSQGVANDEDTELINFLIHKNQFTIKIHPNVVVVFEF